MMRMALQSDFARLSVFAQRLLKNWGPSMAIYGGTLSVVGLYMTDWQVINTKIPFYGKKFDDEGNL